MERLRIRGLVLGFLAGGLLVPAAPGQWNPPNPVVRFEKSAQGLTVTEKYGVLRLDVDADDLLHVTYAADRATAPRRPADDVVVTKDWPGARFDVSSDGKAIALLTAKLRVVIERETGAVHYLELQGATGVGATGPGSTGGAMQGRLLTTDGYRSLRPVEVNGEQALHAEVSFAIYGSHEGL